MRHGLPLTKHKHAQREAKIREKRLDMVILPFFFFEGTHRLFSIICWVHQYELEVQCIAKKRVIRYTSSEYLFSHICSAETCSKHFSLEFIFVHCSS